jgi:hypothetical protein
MFIADICLQICAYLDIAGNSSLLRTSKVLWTMLNRHIQIEKSIRREMQLGITIMMRRIECLDLIENHIISDTVDHNVYHFEKLPTLNSVLTDYGAANIIRSNGQIYTIFADRYLRARIIVRLIDYEDLSFVPRELHIYPIAFNMVMDIFDVIKCARAYFTDMYDRDTVHKLNILFNNYIDAGQVTVFNSPEIIESVKNLDYNIK